jgi:hypothetical protein
MFLAFNKDALAGKSFAEFGKSMEARYGSARAVYRDDKTRGGISHVLDHFAWTAGGDRLKLVDRSEFYGVYCLVLYDQGTHERVSDKRKIVNPGNVEKDELVESVANRGGEKGNDENDDIIDRVVGHETKKPGTEEHADIVVPSTSGKAVSPSQVNAKSSSSSSSASSSGESKKKASKKSNDALDGLEL